MSKVTKDNIVNRIKGMIYGHCLGDAVGLITEFKIKADKPIIKFPYTEPIDNYQVCDWSDDTDHLILVMQTLIDTADIDCQNINNILNTFAVRLKHWAEKGFPELGDTKGLGIGGTTSVILKHEKYSTNPVEAATDIWCKSGKRLAPNGSLMRTSILSALDKPTLVEKFSFHLSLITHVDPRCISSCVFLNSCLYSLIHENAPIDIIVARAATASKKYIDIDIAGVGAMAASPPTTPTISTAAPPLSTPSVTSTASAPSEPDYRTISGGSFKSRNDEMAWWVKTGYTKTINELKLDEPGKIGYVFKCLGSVAYSLQVLKYAQTNNQLPSFKKIIIKIAEECGDADTNCAVAGAVIGAYIGYDRLPRDWLEALPHKKWLDSYIDKFISKFIIGDPQAPLPPTTPTPLPASQLQPASPLPAPQLHSQPNSTTEYYPESVHHQELPNASFDTSVEALIEEYHL